MGHEWEIGIEKQIQDLQERVEALENSPKSEPVEDLVCECPVEIFKPHKRLYDYLKKMYYCAKCCRKTALQ